MSQRIQRVNQLIKQELAELFTRGLRRELPAFTTITDVAVAVDLRTAKVAVSVYGSEEEAEEVLAILREEAGRLRYEIGNRIHLKYTPELSFELDESFERADRLEELFHEIQDGDDA